MAAHTHTHVLPRSAGVDRSLNKKLPRVPGPGINRLSRNHGPSEALSRSTGPGRVVGSMGWEKKKEKRRK